MTLANSKKTFNFACLCVRFGGETCVIIVVQADTSGVPERAGDGGGGGVCGGVGGGSRQTQSTPRCVQTASERVLGLKVPRT